ncbi:MAG: hypothetical protein DVB23_000039 [Verrucomicrobia bacterium]|jgi:hypothetical protein|nr:MAG: hypothetical protein DVB23_000039 [Verrucomicrobiota bacterium]
MRNLLAILILASALSSCETLTLPGAQGEPRAKTVLTEEQAARKFFEAYKNHNRLAASQVASAEAVGKLNWNPLSGSASNLQLQETGEGYAITYDGGAIHLVILGDGHVGHNVADVRVTAD